MDKKAEEWVTRVGANTLFVLNTQCSGVSET